MLIFNPRTYSDYSMCLRQTEVDRLTFPVKELSLNIGYADKTKRK